MDPNMVKPELNEALLAVTKQYVADVDAGNLDAMEQWYAPEFVNIRYDKLGQAVNIPKTAFMNLLRSWEKAGTGHPLPPAQETHFVATSSYGDCSSVLMIRNKGGEVVAYNFVWQKKDGAWHILREFTLHDQLPMPKK